MLLSRTRMAAERERLRILYLTPYYKPYLGGIERVIERLSAGMLGKPEVEAVGVLTTHFAFPRKFMPGLPDRDLIDGGVRLLRVPAWPHIAPPYFAVPLVYWPPRAFKHAIDEFRPNVMHWFGDGWFAGHALAALCAPGAGIVQSLSHHTLPADRLWTVPITAALLRRVDRLTALSAIEIAEVERQYGVAPGRQTLLPWGADGDAEPRPPRDPATPLTVLCVGRLGRHKNQRLLIEAFAAALPQLRRPARLVLVGREEDAEADLRRQVAAGGLSDVVQFAGEVSDAELRAWYRRADLFALLSRYEAFGLVFIEAMASGTPVLTHRVGANSELLREGAVLVPAYDRAAATGQLVRLLNDDAAREALGQRGRQYAQQYTWPPVLDRFTAIYQEALAARRRRLRAPAVP
jgi:glycosyltransferase involved in cell wall biosynthesis